MLYFVTGAFGLAFPLLHTPLVDCHYARSSIVTKRAMKKRTKRPPQRNPRSTPSAAHR